MITVVKSTVQHFQDIEIQEYQQSCREHIKLNPNYAKILCEQGTSYTGIDEQGRIIGMMGLLFRHENCAEGWAILSPYVKQNLKSVVKAVRKVMKDNERVRRIYCTVATNFPEAHRLVRAFGFKPEGILEKWDQFGMDHVMYTIIHNDIHWELI